MSKIEERFKSVMQEETHYGLVDKNGDDFNIKTDAFFDNTYIELKECPLNRKTSISSCKAKLKAQLLFRCPTYRVDPDTAPDCHNALSRTLWILNYRKDCLNYAWNHSAVKHSISSKALKGKGFGYVVVFADHPPFVEHYGKRVPFKKFYKDRYNLDVMLESEAWQWIQGEVA